MTHESDRLVDGKPILQDFFCQDVAHLSEFRQMRHNIIKNTMQRMKTAAVAIAFLVAGALAVPTGEGLKCTKHASGKL